MDPCHRWWSLVADFAVSLTSKVNWVTFVPEIGSTDGREDGEHSGYTGTDFVEISKIFAMKDAVFL